MKLETDKHIPKGKIVSPVRRAIVAWLCGNGAATRLEIQAAMAKRGFLTDRISYDLCDLRKAGFLTKTKTGAGRELLYDVAGSGAQGDARVAPVPAAVPAPCVKCSVAAPRRIDVMHGAPLAGGDDAPAREGAMDYAALPSLVSGQRVPHRMGRAAP